MDKAMIVAMRGWAADCGWLDADMLDDYTDAQIVRGVARHYDGGVDQFCRDMD
jgi:hypothetical protein